jgi:hypothetical protein
MDLFDLISNDTVHGYAFYQIMSIYSAFLNSKTKCLYDIIMPPDFRAHVIPIFSIKVMPGIYFKRPDVKQINISCSEMKYCRINKKMVTALINDKGGIIEIIPHDNICDMFDYLIDLTKIPEVKKEIEIVKKKEKKEIIPGLFA